MKCLYNMCFLKHFIFICGVCFVCFMESFYIEANKRLLTISHPFNYTDVSLKMSTNWWKRSGKNHRRWFNGSPLGGGGEISMNSPDSQRSPPIGKPLKFWLHLKTGGRIPRKASRHVQIQSSQSFSSKASLPVSCDTFIWSIFEGSIDVSFTAFGIPQSCALHSVTVELKK